MAYKMKTTAPIKKDMAEFREAADKMKKIDKKDKKALKSAKDDLDKMGKSLGQSLVDIMTAVTKDANICGKFIDEKSGEAAEHLRLVKTRSDKFDKDQDPKHLEGLTSPNIGDVILRLQKDCKDEDNAFGASWFEIRGLTATGASKELPGPDFKPHAVKFAAMRSELMGRSKEYGTKVDNMEAMAEEARFLIGEMLADAFTQKGAMSEEAAEEYVGELAEKVTTWDTNSKEEYRKQLAKIVRFTETAKDMVDEKDVQVLISSYRDFISFLKLVGAKVKVYDTMVKKSSKRCKGISDKADKRLDQIGNMLKTWTQYIQAGAKKAQEVVVAANDLQKRVDKMAA